MATSQNLTPARIAALLQLVIFVALPCACDDGDASPASDDSDFDTGSSQAAPTPNPTQVDVDANPSRVSGSILSSVDAALDDVQVPAPPNVEGGASTDAWRTATLEGGVTVSVSVSHDSGIPDSAQATGDARTDSNIAVSTSPEGGPCSPDRSLCGIQCVDTAADPLSCGSCGHDCQGGSCVSGQCQPVVIASGLSEAVGLAVDGSNAYFSAGGVVYECPVGGCGNSPELLADSQDAVGGVTVDAANVYWTTADSVMTCAIGGCGDSPTALATNLANPWGIAVDATRVYWAGYDDGTVAWIPLSGGPGITVAAGTSPQYIAVNAERVYFTDVGDGVNGTVSAWAGGLQNPDVLATGPSPDGIATDGATVFWTAGNASNPGATVNACAVGGCNATPDVLASDTGLPQRIAVDASGVYWANGDIYVIRAGTSTAVALTSGQTATDIAIDDSSVYWIEAGVFDDSVMRVAK